MRDTGAPQVPLAPPEDILSWLQRIGLLEEAEGAAGDEDQTLRSDRLLDDEFDLDAEDEEDAAISAMDGGMGM